MAKREITIAPDLVKRPSSTMAYVLFGIALLAVVGVTGFVWWNVTRERPSPTPVSGDETRSKQIGERYLKLHNAGDPAASDLLGTVPALPADAISEDKADALQTEFFLRDPGLRLISVRYKSSKKQAHYLVFRTSGNVAAPRFPVLTKDGVVSPQRTMVNPDLHVWVEDGKITGYRATLQRDHDY